MPKTLLTAEFITSICNELPKMVDPVESMYHGKPASSAIVDITKAPGYEALNRLQQHGARRTSQLLAMAEGIGHIDSGRIKSVCDFGAGIGGPTFALRHHFRLPERSVTALERRDSEIITQSGILPKAQVITGDGLAHLRSGEKQYDLITANMLGSDAKGSLFIYLVNAAKHSLSPEGKLLVCSDPATMETVKKLCESNKLNYRWIDGVPADPPVPSTAIISLDKSAKELQSPSSNNHFPVDKTIPTKAIYDYPLPDDKNGISDEAREAFQRFWHKI